MKSRREVLLQLGFPESRVSKNRFTLSPTNKNGDCNKLWLEFRIKKWNEKCGGTWKLKLDNVTFTAMKTNASIREVASSRDEHVIKQG